MKVQVNEVISNFSEQWVGSSCTETLSDGVSSVILRLGN
jgi:hypothetical protein